MLFKIAHCGVVGRQIDEKNISNFYDNESSENTDLAMNYINYLNEACSKVSIRFKPFVYQIRNNSNSVICLDFHLKD